MTRAILLTVRYGIPGALVLTGLVLLVVADRGAGLDGWALFTGAGLAILFLNLAFRFGATGDRERDEEDAARAFYARHGRWPDDPPERAGRRS